MTNALKWYELPAERWQERDSKGNRIWRDSQKQKLYDAEQILRTHFTDVNTQFESIEEIKQYVNKLLKSAWLKRRIGGALTTIEIIEIKGHTAYGGRCSLRMQLPKWAWNKVVILHELTHIIQPFSTGTSHGRCFCKILLELIGHELGLEAKHYLKKKFIEYGIRSTPHPVYSEKTKIKKKEHGKKLAAKYGIAKNKISNDMWNKTLSMTFGAS